jgi:PAS domain S-box-containing protein
LKHTIKLFENSPAGVAFISLDGKFKEVNTALCRMLNYTKAELLQLSDNDITHPEDVGRELELMKELTPQSAFQYITEKRYLKKDGNPLSVQLHASIVTDPELHESFILAVITDLTHHKTIEERYNLLIRQLEDNNRDLVVQEEELRATNEELTANQEDLLETNARLEKTSSELSERNFELDQFVYKVSHDLRSPLVTILGLVNLAKLEEDLPIIKNYIDLIENRVSKLDAFLKSMLNYLKINRTEISFEKINFEEIIQEVLTDLEFMTDFKRVKKQWVLHEECDFYSDPLRIRVIFQNIISNAIKYQNLYEPSSYLYIIIRIDEKQAQINFTDNGIGMSKEHLKNIFQIFYRASSKSDGSGLGMYIVKQAIEKLKGTISIESPSSKGMSTKVVLPNLTPLAR